MAGTTNKRAAAPSARRAAPRGGDALGGMRDPLGDPLARSAHAGRLTSDQVRVDRTPRLDLPREAMAGLARKLEGVGDAAASPVPDALQDGTAKSDGGRVTMPGLASASSADDVARSVADLGPKEARVVAGPGGYDVQARLNPWVSVHTGNYCHGVPEPTSPLRDGTLHPTIPYVMWSNQPLAPFEIGSFGDGPDRKWTPQRTLQEGMRRGPQTPMEQVSHTMTGTTRVNTGSGMVTASKGWGGQPKISSRREDYNGRDAPTDYIGLARILDGVGDGQVLEDLAHRMLRVAEGGFDPFLDLTDEQRRAANMWLGITQIAEEHPKRTPGSGSLARAGLQAVADGGMTFTESLRAMPFTPKGGTKDMREVKEGKRKLDDNEEFLGGLMDDSFEPLWETPTCKWPKKDPDQGPTGGGLGGGGGLTA